MWRMRIVVYSCGPSNEMNKIGNKTHSLISIPHDQAGSRHRSDLILSSCTSSLVIYQPHDSYYKMLYNASAEHVNDL